MRVVFTEWAKKEWRRLDHSVQNQLRKKLSFYLSTRNPLRFATKLKNPLFGEYRFRIGNYRIIFDFKDDIIFVLRVGDRKDIYK